METNIAHYGFRGNYKISISLGCSEKYLPQSGAYNKRRRNVIGCKPWKAGACSICEDSESQTGDQTFLSGEMSPSNTSIPFFMAQKSPHMEQVSASEDPRSSRILRASSGKSR